MSRTFADAHAPADPRAAGGRAKSLKQRIAPFLVVGAIALAGFLLWRTLRQYSFDEIVASVLAVQPSRLAAAAGFAAASYVCLTFFDFMAVRYAGTPLPYRRTAIASFCALSLGHNLGFAAVSSGAIRYRFYSRFGLSTGQVAKVILFCGLTVGLGLMILAGIALSLQPTLAAEIAGLDPAIARMLGLACLAAAGIYLVLCATVRGRLTIRGWSLEMPPLRLGLGQVLIGPLNFACVAACLHQALASAADVSYFAVASVYVTGNVAALITHVPGGLGVLEATVIYLLPGANFIGALLVFRFVYFLVPLAIGGPTFAAIELRLRHRKRRR